VYREPHLQKKSEECSKLWWDWHASWINKDPDHQEKRKKWSECSDEFAKLISQEVKTNPRYHGIRM